MSATVQSIRKPMPHGWPSLAMLCWGGFTDTWPGAIVMALMLEAIALSPIKWAMANREFHRAADLTSVIFAIVTVVQFSRYSVHGIYQILIVTPFCFFPLLLAQRASTRQTIPMSALFYGLRRYPEHDSELDIAPHYIVICILASSTATQSDSVFIALTGILVIGLIAAARPQRYRWWQWSAALALALAVAAGTQLGVLRTHAAMEDSFMYWLNQFPWSSSNPNRAITAIGAIGRLKLSDQIRVRVTPGRAVKLPLLLQQASYDGFTYGSWSAQDADFAALDKIAGRDAWTTTAAAVDAEKQIEITFQHRRELAMLPLPRGTRRVVSTEIAELQRNRFGTILAESPPGALRFKVAGGQPVGIEPPPTARDLAVPESYREVINQTANEIGIEAGQAGANAARIRAFFLDNFKYSLIQRGGYMKRTPLAHFLTDSRRGHCEYFATASVLLLRAAGIPARYAVGYVVEDYSELERAYIARARHAHAWALAHIDGQWVTVDSTPAAWFDLENELASGWQDIQDLAMWLWFRYQRLSQDDFAALNDLMIWLVPPLAIVLYLRLRKSPIAVRESEQRRARADVHAHSPLKALLEALKMRGLVPQPGETMARFLTRATPSPRADEEIEEIIDAYCRLRFCVKAMTQADVVVLEERIQRYAVQSAG